MFEARFDLDTAFAEAGLAPFAAPVARLCQPALCLVDDGTADAAQPGRSRLGGTPDLPPDLEWPAHAAYFGPGEELTGRRATMREAFTTPAPLHFIVQIDLEAAARTGALNGLLPERGRLLLFWDPKGGPWVDSTASCRVIWDRSPVSALASRAAPAGLSQSDAHFNIPAQFAAKPVAFLRALSMPDRWLLPDLALRAGEQDLLGSLEDPDWEDAWDAFWENVIDTGRTRLASGRKVLPHRVGGWPVPEQGDPRYTAAEAALGIGARPTEADRARVASAMHEWTMLAQIELNVLSSAFAEGVVYFVMRADDLKAGNFDSVHAIYQQT